MMKGKSRLPRAILLIASFLVIGACIFGGLRVARFIQQQMEPPGKGGKAQAGYTACQPVIDALERYYNEKVEYPDTLTALVPGYLESFPQEVNGEPIKYSQKDDSYTLAFSYLGPGINHCTYAPEAGWDCYGYY